VIGGEDEQSDGAPDANAHHSLIVEESVFQLRKELVVSGSLYRSGHAPRVEPIGEHVLCESNRTFLRGIGLALQRLRLLLPRDEHRDEAHDRKDRPEEEADPIAGASIGVQRVLPHVPRYDNNGPAITGPSFPSAPADRR
jgi:hypothetical protein